jgi:hypothetical protein
MRSDAVMFASHDYPAVLPISRTAIAGTFERYYGANATSDLTAAPRYIAPKGATK